MSQLQPNVDLVYGAPHVARRTRALPGWVGVLLRNPKGIIGLSLIGFMVVVALIAPLISVSNPE